MTATSPIHLYRISTALNNNAVSLLARGYHNEAKDALTHAVNAISGIVRPALGYDDVAVSSSIQSLYKELHQSSQQLAQPNLRKARSPLHTTVISASDSTPLAEVALEGIAANSAILLRIDPEDFDPCCDRDIDLESGIVLLNYATAYRSLAGQAQVSAKRKVLSVAASLLELAFSNLAGRCSVIESDSQLKQIVPVAMIALQSLIQVSMELGMMKEARNYYTQLANLRELMMELADSDMEMELSTAAAA